MLYIPPLFTVYIIAFYPFLLHFRKGITFVKGSYLTTPAFQLTSLTSCPSSTGRCWLSPAPTLCPYVRMCVYVYIRMHIYN